MSKKKSLPFDKYEFYRDAVQSPEVDVEFIRKQFKRLRGKYPKTLREDFCGSFALCCEWVKYQKEHLAIGVDLDSEPIHYGKKHYLTELKRSERERVEIIKGNVLNPRLPKADVICALNFSYFIFKSRPTLKKYFANCLRTLKSNGVFMLDVFGGPACHEANEEKHPKQGFAYFWDQKNWDPIQQTAQFAIHFKPHGKPKIKDVFTYDWRMWGIAELQDLLLEVGFKDVVIY